MSPTVEALKIAKFRNEVKSYSVHQLLVAFTDNVLQNLNTMNSLRAEISILRDEITSRTR